MDVRGLKGGDGKGRCTQYSMTGIRVPIKPSWSWSKGSIARLFWVAAMPRMRHSCPLGYVPDRSSATSNGNLKQSGKSKLSLRFIHLCTDPVVSLCHHPYTSCTRYVAPYSVLGNGILGPAIQPRTPNAHHMAGARVSSICANVQAHIAMSCKSVHSFPLRCQ